MENMLIFPSGKVSSGGSDINNGRPIRLFLNFFWNWRIYLKSVGLVLDLSLRQKLTPLATDIILFFVYWDSNLKTPINPKSYNTVTHSDEIIYL